jgi:hypothetical protein
MVYVYIFCMNYVLLYPFTAFSVSYVTDIAGWLLEAWKWGKYENQMKRHWMLPSQQQAATLLHAGQNSRRYATESFSNKIRNNVSLGIQKRTPNSRTKVQRGGFC